MKQRESVYKRWCLTCNICLCYRIPPLLLQDLSVLSDCFTTVMFPSIVQSRLLSIDNVNIYCNDSADFTGKGH